MVVYNFWYYFWRQHVVEHKQEYLQRLFVFHEFPLPSALLLTPTTILASLVRCKFVFHNHQLPHVKVNDDMHSMYLHYTLYLLNQLVIATSYCFDQVRWIKAISLMINTKLFLWPTHQKHDKLEKFWCSNCCIKNHSCIKSINLSYGLYT